MKPSIFCTSVLAPVLVLVAACSSAPELPVVATVDEMRLETSLGTLLTESELAGRPHVVDFIFTSCEMACPLMTAKMKRLADELADEDVGFLSISTDPDRDSVEVLHEYAARYGIDEERWHFARAPKDELVRISEKEFLLGAAGFPAGHSLKFVLVDGERRIRGYYDSESGEELDRLRRDLRSLL